MTRWTDFIKEWVKHHGGSYKEALSNPEVKQEYWTIYPKHSPAGKEYQRVKEQTTKFQRDEAQKDLMDMVKQQKLKDKTNSYRRDETQKELMGIARYQKLEDKQQQFADYGEFIPQVYELKHKFNLIRDNTKKYTQLHPKIQQLQSILYPMITRLKKNIQTTNFITGSEYKKIKRIKPMKLGIRDGSVSKRIVGIIDKLIEQAEELDKKI